MGEEKLGKMYLPDRDHKRALKIPETPLGEEPYRSPFRQDYARLIHSPAFRRLAGKTQLFPSGESDFFRNRLTHSLEVAQVAKSIGLRLNHHEGEKLQGEKLDLDLLETAALAHDIGHPPFGHNGEEVLHELLATEGGFEGNAQTLRILSTLEKKQVSFEDNGKPYPINPETKEDCRLGLNLTFRTLAAVLKYDDEIPATQKAADKIHKGYYPADAKLVGDVKNAFGVSNGGKKREALRTIECSIMDVSDDIAYSTYDLEDSLKSGLITPTDLLAASEETLEAVAEKVQGRFKSTYDETITLSVPDVLRKVKGIFDRYFTASDNATFKFDENPLDHPLRTTTMGSKSLADNGYVRSQLTSWLIGRRIRKVEIFVPPQHKNNPALWQVRLEREAYIETEILKNLIFEMLIRSPGFQAARYKGQKILTEIWEALKDDMGRELLPMDYRGLYEAAKGSAAKTRVLADFVAGMTDHYAVEFHRRLTSGDAPPVTQRF
jgi:dGTPase